MQWIVLKSLSVGNTTESNHIQIGCFYAEICLILQKKKKKIFRTHDLKLCSDLSKNRLRLAFSLFHFSQFLCFVPSKPSDCRQMICSS